jgi:hypothetical protein
MIDNELERGSVLEFIYAIRHGSREVRPHTRIRWYVLLWLVIYWLLYVLRVITAVGKNIGGTKNVQYV